jgi:hypothetical protein
MRKYDFIHLFTYWLFWHLVPTVEITLKWPVGEIVVRPGQPGWDWTMGATQQLIFSSDPNDHYRPWLEEHVGRQGWAWDWELSTHDVLNNRLTLKVRRDKAKYASMAAMRWT